MSDMCTGPQGNYLLILFQDLGFTRDQRNVFLSAETGREIHFLDQLTKAEAHKFIEDLKAREEERKPAPESECA